jgi:hypothetical protein
MKHVPTPEGEPLTGLDNLAMAVPPKWGDAILRLAKATERVATKLDELPAITGDQYIPKARELAKSLIDFLDGLEDTDQDAACDDEPCDTDELEIAEGDDEPSLGSTGHGNGGPISYAIPVFSAGGEFVHDCEGDEHDGREPQEDDEPSLGSFDGMVSQLSSWKQRAGWFAGSDREQDDCDDEEDDPEELSEASGIGDQDGLQEQYSGRIFPSGLKIEGVE